MNVLMKWLSITVLIFSTFASNETKLKSQYKGVCWNPEREKWYVDIEFKGEKASWSGLFKDELDAAKRVNQICENLKIPHLNPGIGSNSNENHQNISSLYRASKNGRKDTVKSLLEEEKENLIEFVMKRNIGKFTALHLASKEGHEEIVKLLLNVFCEKEKEKLIQYVLIENIMNETALNYALANEHKTVVKLLLNVFGKEDEKILLSQKLVLENNKKLLWDLRFITKMFKSQTKDAKKNSPLWSIFSNLPAKNTILSFIITDYYYNVFGRHGAEENILKIFSTNYNYEKIQVPTFPIIPHKKYRIILPLGIDILNGPDPISQVDGHLACGTIVKVLEVTHDTAKIEQGWIMLSNDIGKRIMAPEKDPINLKVFCFFLFISALISYCLHKIL